jgi:pilus assembly protein CpaE
MFDVLMAGRVKADLVVIENVLRQHDGVAIRPPQVDVPTMGPLSDREPLPDLLVLSLEAGAREELEALSKLPAHERPSVLVVGPQGDLELMRLAMRAGARDFFFNPPPRDELLSAVDRAIKEKESRNATTLRRVVVTVNAKGGAGASFIATNVAERMASHLKSKVALLDMDLQFGYLAANLSVQANDGLHQALESIGTLDGVALEGWAAKHKSGVHIFGNTHRQLLLTRDFPEEPLDRLLSLLTRTYGHVVIDIPRHIDHVFAMCVQHADTVVIVLQQNVAQLRDARALITILQRDLALRDEQIVVVVNRWSNKALVSLKDIQQGLRRPHLHTIANDFKNVSQSLNLGVPMHEINSRAGITRHLDTLARTVGGIEAEKKGFLRRLLGSNKE